MRAKKGTDRAPGNALGLFVRRMRKALFPGVTIEEFAQRLGIRGSYLTRIELGRVPPPSYEVIEALADTLMTDVQFLVGLAGYEGKIVSKSRGQSSFVGEFPSCIEDLLGDITLERKLSYWGHLCLVISEYIARGKLDLDEKSITRESILTLATYCGMQPFHSIREEAARRVQSIGSKRREI